MTRNFLWSLFCDDINLQLEDSFVLWGEGICFLGSFCLVPVINADMQLQVTVFFVCKKFKLLLEIMGKFHST